MLVLGTHEGRTNSVLGELGNSFSPEFMNRFDGIINLNLSKDSRFSRSSNIASGCQQTPLWQQHPPGVTTGQGKVGLTWL